MSVPSASASGSTITITGANTTTGTGTGTTSTTTSTSTTSAFKDLRRQGRGVTATAVRAITKSDANTQTDTTETDTEKTQVEPAEKSCSICLEPRDQVADPANTTITSCGHLFCTSCLLKHLIIRNTCPNCRAEIEPSRAPVIEPLTADTVATIIREEEAIIDVTRRIAVISVFPDNEGRAAMILSLARELAFGAAHSMAGWQGTDDTTYHSSWNRFEYSQQEDDEDDEGDDEGDDEDDDDDENDDDDDDNDDDVADSDGEDGDDDGDGDDCEKIHQVAVNVVVATPNPDPSPTTNSTTPLSGRALFQSPRFSLTTDTTATTTMITPVAVTTEYEPAVVEHRGAYEISGWGLILRFIVVTTVLYFEFARL